MSEILHSQWPCPYCPQLFSTSADLRNHLDDRVLTTNPRRWAPWAYF